MSDDPIEQRIDEFRDRLRSGDGSLAEAREGTPWPDVASAIEYAVSEIVGEGLAVRDRRRPDRGTDGRIDLVDPRTPGDDAVDEVVAGLERQLDGDRRTERFDRRGADFRVGSWDVMTDDGLDFRVALQKRPPAREGGEWTILYRVTVPSELPITQ